MSLDKKIEKIKGSLLEMNDKVLKYIADLMGKVFSDSIESIVKFILNLEQVDRDKLMPLLESAHQNMTNELSNNIVNVGGITNRINNLKTLETLNVYLNELNHGGE